MRIALVLFFLLCGVGAFAEDSQPPPPSRGEKVKQPDSYAQKKNEASDQLKICAESLAAINKLLNAQEQEKTANNTTSSHKEESAAEWWKKPDIWVAVFTGILAVITGALAYFTLMLWRATKTMVDEASLTSIRQATETKDALEVSRNAANAAMEQAKISTDALQRSNRAWLGLAGPVEMITPLSFDKNNVCCNIRLTVKNVGASPAVGTCLTCKLIVGPHPPHDPRTYITVVDEGFIQAATIGFGIPVIPGDPMQWSTIEFREPINQNSGQSDVSIWLTGYFWYKDEFGFQHSSSFLFSFVTPDGDRKITPNKSVKGRFEPFGAGWVNT